MMKAYRIGHKAFINDLEGTGARLYGGRWNPEGMPCIYASMHLSLALLEKFVHAQRPADMQEQAVIVFQWKDDLPLYTLELSKMKPDWATNTTYTHWLGQQVLLSPRYAGLIVPSAIVPWEKNIVLNPLSPAFGSIVVDSPFDFEIDRRMIGKLQT
jgi:RES domain-containing protein